MLARHGNIFPNAMWKSSLAVFAYDPDLSDLPEIFADRELTFLKVVCSITSYVPCIKLPPPPQERGEMDVNYNQWLQEVDALKKLEQRTYPCYGALVQVAIYPSQGDTTDVSQLAYFGAFEPKKRELIEVATESGESLTQSKSLTNIRKGVTSTDSTEDMNVFTGANVGVGYEGAKVEVGVHGQWGTIKKSGTEQVDTTTADASREAREGSSHTTSLSQLYHLLNSYHLGTNRAIFFIQPRPHTLQQKDRFTFIDGPQEIEGIQEFFLIVSRPKGIKLDNYCVDALLYTAHLDPEAMRTAIQEPKTMESQWVDLYVRGWDNDLLPENSPNSYNRVYSSPGPILPDVANDVSPILTLAQQKYMDDLGRVRNSGWTPGVIDATFQATRKDGTPDEGWRIDRSRGLGGYDLWEDPSNLTANAEGWPSDHPPQGFVDIISRGDPDNLQEYRPDIALRFRAIVWPPVNKPVYDPNKQTKSSYYARIKVYYIRDDQPTDSRRIPMFVTARGVSSCGDSPFSQLYEEPNLDPNEQPEVSAEGTVNPPNIAPWINVPPPPPAPVSSDQGKTIFPPPPIDSSTPSGQDHISVGMARVKMANSIGDLVRKKLKVSFRCTHDGGPFNTTGLIHFQETDFAFQQVAGAVMSSEIGRLLASPDAAGNLTGYVASHPAATSLAGGVGVSLSSIRTAAVGAFPPLQPPVASSSFPALTLASNSLSQQDKLTLQHAGITSGLDLINLPATDLALRLGVDPASARQIRTRAIGLSTGQ